jgi:low affinity Fe/Cu permease
MSSPRTRPPGKFDEFATAVSNAVSRAWFFSVCVLIVALWAPSFFVFRSVDTWQLIINTLTTIITFLLVALLQNTQYRSNEAVQKKLNAIAEGIADLMESQQATDSSMSLHVEELRQAVGLEHKEGT